MDSEPPCTDVLLVFSTLPDVARARAIATTLVEEELAACVNIVPSVESIYAWQGEVQKDSEVLALIKTRKGHYAELEARLQDLHPYQTPEILCIPVAAGSRSYLAWIRETLAQTDDEPKTSH